MDQARPDPGLYDDITPAKFLCLQSSIKKEIEKMHASTYCCLRILSEDFSMTALKREET